VKAGLPGRLSEAGLPPGLGDAGGQRPARREHRYARATPARDPDRKAIAFAVLKLQLLLRSVPPG
jgi:hypothetical protein